MAQTIRICRIYPTAYGLGPDFERIVAEWRPELLKE